MDTERVEKLKKLILVYGQHMRGVGRYSALNSKPALSAHQQDSLAALKEINTLLAELDGMKPASHKPIEVDIPVSTNGVEELGS